MTTLFGVHPFIKTTFVLRTNNIRLHDVSITSNSKSLGVKVSDEGSGIFHGLVIQL